MTASRKTSRKATRKLQAKAVDSAPENKAVKGPPEDKSAKTSSKK